MNLFKREFKANYKGLIIWTVAAMLLSLISYWEYGLADAATQMSDLFAGFPDIVNTLFGVSPLGVNDVVGYSALIIYYIYFIGLIYALSLGTRMIQKELDDQTSEFLFTKPISRSKILYIKTTVAKLNLFLFAFITMLLTMAMMINVSDGTYTNNEIIQYCAFVFFGLYLLMMITYLVTMAANISFTNKRYGLIAGGVFILYSYATSIIVLSFEQFKDFTIISPWRYFSPDIIINEGLSFLYIIICVLICYGLYFISDRKIQSKMM